ncbi:unnamed protein product [Lathyrus sativus]|nr:unnamed protein product [Lathyrus sativus]
MEVIVTLVLIFVGIVILIIFHASLTEWFSRRGSMIDRSKRRISKIDLEKLPCYDYVAKENTSNTMDCAICLENFTIGDKCRLLPSCKHSFHAQCVDKWLLENSICPICRSRVCSYGGKKVMCNNGGGSIESGSSRNVGIELRENNPTTLEVESQEH